MFQALKKKLVPCFTWLLSLVLLAGCAAQGAPEGPGEEPLRSPGLPEEADGVIPFAQIYYYEDSHASQYFWCSWNTENNTFSRGELFYTGALHDDYIPEEWAAIRCHQQAGDLLYTRDGQEQTAKLPENAPGELCCAAVEDGTVTAVYKEGSWTETELTAIVLHLAHYSLGQPEAAEWVRAELTESETLYLSTAYTSDCVYAEGKVYLEAGETIVAVDSRSGGVEQLELRPLEMLCPEGSHSGENGYYGARIYGAYGGVLFVTRQFVTEAGKVSVVAAYRGTAPLAAVVSDAAGGMDQLYLSDGAVLRAAGDFSLSAEGGYHGFLFPERYWKLGY